PTPSIRPKLESLPFQKKIGSVLAKRLEVSDNRRSFINMRVIYQWNIFEFVYSWQLQGRQPLESIGKQIDKYSTDILLKI
ncbi:MAG: hypothetical protein LBC20_13410, partial [Planctomycetaceae bacterium]|nr:hypothetical protein [Planctomycetaceae bacterium]